MSHLILRPALALVGWTLVLCGWLYAIRIPAIRRHNVVYYDPARPADEFHAELPVQVRWNADNDNNLMEQQPDGAADAVLCHHAVIRVRGTASRFHVALAWSYVALRTGHSIVPATINRIALRFPLFIAAALVLVGMTVRRILMTF